MKIFIKHRGLWIPLVLAPLTASDFASTWPGEQMDSTGALKAKSDATGEVGLAITD